MNNPSACSDKSMLMYCSSPNENARDADEIRSSEMNLLQNTSNEILQHFKEEQLNELRKDISQSISEISYLEAAIKKARRAEKEALERIAAMEQSSLKRENNNRTKNHFIHDLNAILLNEESNADFKNKTGLHHGIRLAPTDIVFQATEESLLQNMKCTQKLQESIDASNTSVQK
jgi:hypothetical protein